jgi:hypothetical protein
MRKKLHFPWEIPNFASEDALRDFWDSHEITDELLGYSKVCELTEIFVGEFKITFEIKNIPAITNWRPDGVLISSRYEDHVEEKLDKLKRSLADFSEKNLVLVDKSRVIEIDFISGQRLIENNP